MHRARKRFGQNFLHDPAVIDKIIAAVDAKPGERIVEIGPGHGALTAHLIDTGARLAAVEVDRDLAATLADRFPALELHVDDALRFDFSALAGTERLRVVGNLPYNISTPVLFHLAAHAPVLHDLHVMLQKEVVDRVCARPGQREYGRLTVMLAVHFSPTPLFDIGPGAFRPAPKVRSTFLRLLPHAKPPFDVADRDRFAELVRVAFSHRRKTLRNALRGVVDEHEFVAAGIDSGSRPGELSPQEFARLAAAPPPDRPRMG